MSQLETTFFEFFNILTIQTVVVTVFFLSFIYYFLKIRDVPPGPWGIPFIGYWPFLKEKGGHMQLKELTNKYGDVFSFTVTGNLCICLNSIKSIKEAHLEKSENFGDRITDYSMLTETFKGSMAMINGEPWSVLRKFFAQKFREYGMITVKEDMSGAIYDSLRETVEEMRDMEGQPIAFSDLLTVKCSVIIRRILFNDQGITEEELKELNHEYGPVLSSHTYKNMLLMGNFARFFILPFMPSYWGMIRGHNRIHSILNSIIMRHKSAFDESQQLDIIDSFYKEKKDRQRKGDPTADYFTDEALLSSVYQFVTDSVLTVSFFIVIILLSLVQHPEEQDKIYEELLEVVGPNRQPTMEDKSKLPYTNAFIYEVIRNTPFFPTFPSLKCTRETTVHGYKIPKGAITVLNVWSAHHDSATYKDPYKFDPSRFLTKPGKQRPDLPNMFGIGKRACIGEPFVMIQAFLFLTTIVKNFSLTLPGDPNDVYSLLLSGNLKICAHSRTQESATKG